MTQIYEVCLAIMVVNATVCVVAASVYFVYFMLTGKRF